MSSKFFLYITFFLLVFFFSEGGQLSVPSLFRAALKIDVRVLLLHTQKQVNLDIHLLCTILNPETLNNYILHVQTWRLHPVFENVHLDKPYQMCNIQVSMCVCTLSGSFFGSWSENGGSSILRSKDNEKHHRKAQTNPTRCAISNTCTSSQSFVGNWSENNSGSSILCSKEKHHRKSSVPWFLLFKDFSCVDFSKVGEKLQRKPWLYAQVDWLLHCCHHCGKNL